METMKHWKRSVLARLLALLPAGLAVARERPNFIEILSDDQSWAGSSPLTDPYRPETE